MLSTQNVRARIAQRQRPQLLDPSQIVDTMKMRQPLTGDEMFAWYHQKMRGERPPTHLEEPHAGFFKTRLVRGGPFVPACIWWEQEIDDAGELLSEPVLRCHIDGRERAPIDVWSWLAGRAVDEDEYTRLLVSRMATPDPVAAARQAATTIDWSKVKPPF